MISYDEKELLYSIITDSSKDCDSIFQEVSSIFPNYMTNNEERTAIYEKIEGIFHDGLGSYFEYSLYNRLLIKYDISQETLDLKDVVGKLNKGIKLYDQFFSENTYQVDREKEIMNIDKGVQSSLDVVYDIVGDQTIIKIHSSSQDFRKGNARDIYIELDGGDTLNFSLKTDKSGKIAIFEGQTSRIREKVYNRYFLLGKDEYENIKQSLFNTNNEKDIFKDFSKVALLTQVIILKQLGLEGGEINNFKNARITHRENLLYLVKQLKRYKRSDDGSFVICLSRETGDIIPDSILDSINTANIELHEFSLTPSSAKKYKYGTEPGIKYRGKTFVSFQTKHKRGKNPSNEFCDITIRLRTK